MTVLRRQRRGGARTAIARAVTEVLAPVVLSVTILIAVAVASARTFFLGLAWGLLAAFFVGVVPYAFLLLGVRRGRWTGRHVPLREQRPVPLLFAAASVLVGVVVLVVSGAPRELVALVVAGLAGLGVSLAITLRWKMSIHAGVAAGAAVVLHLVFGRVALVAWPLVALVGWSRVELRDHTLAQVVAGGVIGAVVAAVVFSTLR